MEKVKAKIYEFDDIEDFHQYLNTQPTTEHFKTANASKGVGKYFTEFTGSESYDVAESLLVNGYADGMEKLMHTQIDINMTHINSVVELVKRQRKYDYAGSRVSVPRMLAGQPKTMVRTFQSKVHTVVPKVSIVYDCGVHVGIDSELSFRVGKLLLSCIIELEKNGIQMQLKSVMPVTDRSNKHPFAAVITLKKYSQRINPLLIAYPIVHPSWLRRHGFRFIEVCPSTVKGMESYYGSLWNRDQKTQFTENGSVLIILMDYIEKSDDEILSDITNKIKKALC